jgi:UDP-N-acetylglucosamine acyltransferase
MSIHPTAIIDKEVELGNNVEVGPYSVISGKVKIGDGTVIKDHVTIYGPLRMGSENKVHPGAVLGDIPQHLSYKDEETEVIIGNNNVFREVSTVQQGSASGTGKTIVGDNNFIMAYSHVAHDCVVGNNIIMANLTQLGGHVVVQDFAYIGGVVGIHQFVTLGRYSFVGFSSRINKDVPPFVIVEGNPARERSINTVGLSRKNFSSEEIALLKKAFKVLFMKKTPLSEKREILTAGEFAGSAHVEELLTFIEAKARGKNGRAQEAMRK